MLALRNSVMALSLLTWAPVQGEPLHVALSGSLANFAPTQTGLSQIERSVSANLFEPLVYFGSGIDFAGVLASEWESSESSDHWIFQLRDGVHFHNGVEMTAEHVVQSLESFAFGREVSIAQIDDLTVEISLDAPWPGFLSTLSGLGIHYPEDGSSIGAVGTGPYTISQIAEHEFVELLRNANYWGGEPAWESVVYRSISDGGSRAQSLISGDSHVVSLDASSAYWSVINSENEVHETLSGFTYHLGVRNNLWNSSPTQLARAISASLDRIALGEVVGPMFLRPTASILAPSRSRFVESESTIPAADTELSASILSGSGYSGEPLRFLYLADSSEYDQDLAAPIVDMMESAGLSIDPAPADSSQYLSSVFNGDENILLFRWGGIDETGALNALLHSESIRNLLGFSSSEVDSLLESAIYSDSLESRNEILVELADLIEREGTIIPLGYETHLWGSSPGYDMLVDRHQRIVAFRVIGPSENHNPKSCGSQERCCQDIDGGRCCHDSSSSCPNSCE